MEVIKAVNPEMATWELLALGGIAILVVLIMMPRIRESMKRAEKQEQKDWKGALIPLALVALFVLLLISMV